MQIAPVPYSALCNLPGPSAWTRSCEALSKESSLALHILILFWATLEFSDAALYSEPNQEHEVSKVLRLFRTRRASCWAHGKLGKAQASDAALVHKRFVTGGLSSSAYASRDRI